MKKLNFIGLLLLGVLCFTACENDDTDLYPAIKDNTAKTIAIDSTDLTETETIPTSSTAAGYDDYVEHAEIDYAVTITYNGTSVTKSGDVNKVTIITSGGNVKVVSAAKNMKYILKGVTTNGSFKIYSDNKFELVLDGVSIYNPVGAAINNQCGKTMYVVLGSGTSNYLKDGTSYTMVNGEDMKGTLFSEGQVIFSGAGSLNVYGNCKNAIVSDDYIRFRPGNKIYIYDTASNGIKAKDGVYINGGVLNVEVTANAAKGINSESKINILGGRTTILTSGSSLIVSADTSSCAAIKCDSVFTLNGGTVNLKSSGEGGKGINANKNIYLKGGTINVVTTGAKTYSSPKSIKTDADIYVTGGSIYSYSANSSPFDATGTLNIATGYTTYTNKTNCVVIQY